jgi:hypothetical protein
MARLGAVIGDDHFKGAVIGSESNRGELASECRTTLASASSAIR